MRLNKRFILLISLCLCAALGGTFLHMLQISASERLIVSAARENSETVAPFLAYAAKTSEESSVYSEAPSSKPEQPSSKTPEPSSEPSSEPPEEKPHVASVSNVEQTGSKPSEIKVSTEKIIDAEEFKSTPETKQEDGQRESVQEKPPEPEPPAEKPVEAALEGKPGGMALNIVEGDGYGPVPVAAPGETRLTYPDGVQGVSARGLSSRAFSSPLSAGFSPSHESATSFDESSSESSGSSEFSSNSGSSSEPPSSIVPPKPLADGWQVIDGKIYFYKNNKPITGMNAIKLTSNKNHSPLRFRFNADGVLTSGAGIDVSEHQGNIDWKSVKNSGIEFAMIRVGFRGYGAAGRLVVDEDFAVNIKGAMNAGIKTGVYFYTQAINQDEALQESEVVLKALKDCGITPDKLSLPVAFDIEYVDVAEARTNVHKLTNSQRTDLCIAFCDKIKSAGYRPMVYATKDWLENMLQTDRLSGYQTWLAHWTGSTSYAGSYSMWQYSAVGRIGGISGDVDLDIMF